MDAGLLRAQIAETGRALLSTGLVARTWGNVSARLTDRDFLITPSGLDYLRTTEADIVLVTMPDLIGRGTRKPSSEKGVHAVAYECFPEVNFVIHTHQTCASALGLAGFDGMSITKGERERLGGVALAAYGLPGTKKLKNAVKAAMAAGAQTVLMTGHGAVIAARDRDDAMERALLLEEICRRNLAIGPLAPARAEQHRRDAVLAAAEGAYPFVSLADGDPAVALANLGKPLYAQLDDMAQMLGRRVNAVPCDPDGVVAALQTHGAVLVAGVGGLARADNGPDGEARRLLLEKSAVCALHTSALGKRVRLSPFDAALMHAVYVHKYAKQKG